MAYQAKRKRIYQEKLELVDENGVVVHTLRVNLDPDSTARNLSEKHVDLVRAMQDLKSIDLENQPENALKKLEAAADDILEATFGKEQAEIILDFYDKRYIELCAEVVPFITGTVIPEIRKMAQESRKTTAAGYNRKQRRMFGRPAMKSQV